MDLVQRHPDLQRALANPAVPAAAKRAVVQQLLERSQPTAPVGKLLLLLAVAGPARRSLPDLLDVYRERLMEHRQVIQAEVTTAVPLAPERVSRNCSSASRSHRPRGDHDDESRPGASSAAS